MGFVICESLWVTYFSGSTILPIREGYRHGTYLTLNSSLGRLIADIYCALRDLLLLDIPLIILHFIAIHTGLRINDLTLRA